MKTSTLVIIMFVGFLTSSINAQETVWFDSNWNITSKQKATYYRPIPAKKGNGFWIVDFYKNGVKQMEGFSSVNTPLKEEYEGVVMYFHTNGNPYQKVRYEKGRLHGKREVYYESGEVKEQGKYNKGMRAGIWKEFYKSGKIKIKGKYKDGEKVGVWKTFYKNE
ncbi:MORN repeat protein [Lutibacter sp. Hel_I_33_5]|uniref:toxin-antitoxin system YwqK family antitoxin n=1 Tax=Lutibacter sp. Hel_I_33_5 TaxID=1566289 RepID=UPI00119F8068|nr:hypothetical protein [Lutibacter sp. Hel_I_33_5]TVZ55818.1 MORN repeat protein [Lutibacter sp. Hel_I_33_5]